MKSQHRPAPALLRWYLRRSGFQAITLPWGAAYYLAWPPPPGLVAHEAIHLDQIRRLGAVRFTAVYIWQLARFGYERHPLEVEARERSGHR